MVNAFNMQWLLFRWMLVKLKSLFRYSKHSIFGNTKKLFNFCSIIYYLTFKRNEFGIKIFVLQIDCNVFVLRIDCNVEIQNRYCKLTMWLKNLGLHIINTCVITNSFIVIMEWRSTFQIIAENLVVTAFYNCAKYLKYLQVRA